MAHRYLEGAFVRYYFFFLSHFSAMSFLRFGDFLLLILLKLVGFSSIGGSRIFVVSFLLRILTVEPLPFTSNTKLHVRDRIEFNNILLSQFL